MPRKKVEHYRTAVFDCETDPFKSGRVPVPFACGFLADDGTKLMSWGDDCVNTIMQQIAELPEKYLIFVHAGGRFDFHFLWDWIEEPVFIVQGRLVEFSQGVTWRGAHHVWRDSYSIIPVPLAEFRKEDIDYAIMEADRRDLPANRRRIESYLSSDLSNLLLLVQRFRTRFEAGRDHLPITVGQLAMRELRRFHEFERATEVTDTLMRPWYFGGRNQCFAGGVLKGPWKCYDVNSHYAKAMRDFDHPLTDYWEELAKPPLNSKTVWFARLRARNQQVLPWRDDTNTAAIHFDMGEAEFFACSHELVPAIAAGMVEPIDWLEIWRPVQHGRFRAFVDEWFPEKERARRRGDEATAIFAKAVLNSVTGKFGQDPRRYRQWALLRDPFLDGRMEKEGYEAETLIRSTPPEDWLELWSRPAHVMRHSFHNVGIAASITSASRAIMLDGLRRATAPVYCDTDSLICGAFAGPRHRTRLGAWKLEAEADYVAIAARKIYCMFNVKGRSIRPVKWAGGSDNLEPKEIIAMAKGGAIEKINQAPVFSLRGRSPFNSRKYEKTVANDVKPFKV